MDGNKLQESTAIANIHSALDRIDKLSSLLLDHAHRLAGCPQPTDQPVTGRSSRPYEDGQMAEIENRLDRVVDRLQLADQRMRTVTREDGAMDGKSVGA